jgi:hypothetical protein
VRPLDPRLDGQRPKEAQIATRGSGGA